MKTKKKEKPTEKRMKYSSDNLKKALNAVNSGMSKKQAAKQFQVPRSTIQFRLNNPDKTNPRPGPSTVLTAEEENSLVNWIVQSSKKGFPRRKEDIQHSVSDFLKKAKRSNPFKIDLPGDKWLKLFLKRHPEIAIRTPESVTAASSVVSESDDKQNHEKTIRMIRRYSSSTSEFEYDTNFLNLKMARNDMLSEIYGSEKELENIIDVPGRTLQLEKKGWSKSKCLEISKLCKIPEGLRDFKTQVAIATKFLNFMGNGVTSNTHSSIDVVLAMAMLLFTDFAKTPQDLVWEETLYSSKDEECGFSIHGDNLPEFDQADNKKTTPEDALQIIGISSEVTDIFKEEQIIFETNEEKQKRAALIMERPEDNITTPATLTKHFLGEFAAGSLHTFLVKAGTMIKDNNVDKGFTRSHLHLFRVLNYIALTMLRKTTRTNAQMALTFLKDQYRKNMMILVPGPLSEVYSPPSKACIEKLTPISKNDPATSSLLAKLVIQWVDNRTFNPKVVGIIGVTILTHTAWNGMGILHMIFEICNHYGVSWKKILNFTLLNTTKISWKEIIEFCKNYQTKDLDDPTVAWARLIDNKYFMSLTISRHINLAALLVDSVIQTQGDEGILSAKWAMDHSNTISHYRPASEKFKDILEGLTTKVEAGTKEASQLAYLVGTVISPEPKETQPVNSGIGFDAKDLID